MVGGVMVGRGDGGRDDGGEGMMVGRGWRRDKVFTSSSDPLSSALVSLYCGHKLQSTENSHC